MYADVLILLSNAASCIQSKLDAWYLDQYCNILLFQNKLSHSQPVLYMFFLCFKKPVGNLCIYSLLSPNCNVIHSLLLCCTSIHSQAMLIQSLGFLSNTYMLKLNTDTDFWGEYFYLFYYRYRDFVVLGWLCLCSMLFVMLCVL